MVHTGGQLMGQVGMAQGVRTPFITARSFLLFCFLRRSLSLLNVVSFPGQIQ